MDNWITWEIVFGFLGTLTVVAGFIVGIYRTREMTRPKPVEETSDSAIKAEMIEFKALLNSLELRIVELKEHQEKIDETVIKEIEKLELRIEKIMDLIIEQLTR